MPEMPSLKTWNDISKFDDLLSAEEKGIIRDAESSLIKCRYLRKLGKSWYYCGAEYPSKPDSRPSPSNPVYLSHVGHTKLQHFCFHGRHKECESYIKAEKEAVKMPQQFLRA